MSNLLAFSWILTIFLSILGWGSLMFSLIGDSSQVKLGSRGVTGLCLLMCMGGWLNLWGIISPALVFSILAFGILLFIFFRAWRYFKLHINHGSWGIYLVCMLLLLLWGVIFFTPFLQYYLKLHPYDDYQSYLVLPMKMLQSGSLGINPYMDRQMENSLGGDHFLQSLVFVLLKPRYAYIIDLSIGSILVLLLITELTVNRGVYVLLLTAGFFLLIFPPKVNSTYVILPLAMFLDLWIRLGRIKPDEPALSSSLIMVALLCSGILLLKTLYSAFIVIFIGIWLITAIFSGAGLVKVIRRSLVISGLVVILLLPWAISSYRSFGTPYYPFFGKGNHISTYFPDIGYVRYNSGLLLATALIFIMKILGIAALGFHALKYSRIRKNPEFYLQITLLSAILISIGLTMGITGGDYFFRYTYPFITGASLILIIPIADVLIKNKKYSLLTFLLLLGLGCASLSESFNFHFKKTQQFLSLNPVKLIQKFNRHPGQGFITLDEPLEKSGEREIYRNLISSVPDDCKVLVFLTRPYLLDLSDERIVLIDTPYALQPGGPMPLENTDELVDYFLNNDIHYIAATIRKEYDRKNVMKMIERIENREYRRWNSTMILHEYFFRMHLLNLSSYPGSYSPDGINFLINLDSHS